MPNLSEKLLDDTMNKTLRKFSFFALMVFGLGVSSTMMAGTVRVYCQTKSWWSKDGAATAIHYWGADIQGTKWPGIRMTKVENETDIWYADVEANANFVFARVNGSGDIEDWGAKTKDLTLPTNGDNLFTVTNTETWGTGCEGAWSKYQPQVERPSSWCILGTFNGWSSNQCMRPHAEGELLYDTIYLEAGREYQFKVRDTKSDKWYGNSGIMTQAHCTGWDFDDKAGDCTIATTIAGKYVFKWELAISKLTITYPNNPQQATLYDSPIREKNPDILLQAFYWAHNGSTSEEYLDYGDVKWAALNAEADTLAKYFDMVWLAPSQETADYTGYLPINYSHQGTISVSTGHSPWGTSTELRELIDHLHNKGAKVIADIVINHSSAAHTDEYDGQEKNWCEWEVMDFGRYGVFQPDYTWITKEDEMFSDKKMSAGSCGQLDNSGNVEDEKNYTFKGAQESWTKSEYDCAYSRDWAHQKREVRELVRAYMTWLRDSIGYDGWRYDFAKGFHGSRIFDYNRASAPYFSVAEVFDGDIDKQLGVLDDTHRYTCMFDFPGKFTIYNEAIRPYKLENLKGNKYTLINKDEHKKYAVTFIDNHDSFREEGKSLNYWPNTIDDRQAQQAICYLFSMPGVPCLVYPYWNNYKEIVKRVILARRAVGVHAQSWIEGDWGACEDASDRNNNTYYTAKIRGEKGYLFLKLGKKSAPLYEPEMGYRLAWGNEEAAVWYKVDEDVPTDSESKDVDDSQEKVKKVMENGHLYILRQGVKYTINGLRCW